MRINVENRSVDMERRDISYILPAYVRSYMFYSKNEMPERIIFPMFPSVTVQGKEIPIDYVPPLDAIAVEIAQDGADIAEVTPEEEAALDEKEDRIKELKAEVESLTQTERGEERLGGNQKQSGSNQASSQSSAQKGSKVSPARAAFATEEGDTTSKDKATQKAPKTPKASLKHDRQPKQPPGGDIGPGLPLSDTHARDRRDLVRTARDLVDEPDIDEAEEKEYEKPISRDEEGKPLVEDRNE